MPRLFIHGFPGLYGGAATELHHQIYVWKEMGLDLHIIPTMTGYRSEPLYKKMLDLGIKIHDTNNFEVISKDDAIINFCSAEFLDNLTKINEKTKRTIFVNCMTWLFDKEKAAHMSGLIGYSLYQRDQVREEHQRTLRSVHNSKGKFYTFVPYYLNDHEFIPNKKNDKYVMGRISRQDSDKFTADLWRVWEGIVAPVWKRGIVLGWDHRSQAKCGAPLDWVETYVDQTKLPVREFWNQVDVCIQRTNTNENWPRIGFEAMYSGAPLVVDARAGWNYMVKHGETGFLCHTDRDFIYYGSKLAYEPEFREQMARKALSHALDISDMSRSKESWEKVFINVF